MCSPLKGWKDHRWLSIDQTILWMIGIFKALSKFMYILLRAKCLLQETLLIENWIFELLVFE